MTERKGDWILTFTGRQFWPLDPRVEEIEIEDIAHALAGTYRYGGHSDPWISVAEHSVYVSEYVAPENALWGLLHDADEALNGVGDIQRPIKRCPESETINALSGPIMRCVCEKFGLPLAEPPDVRDIDARVCHTEMQQVMPWPWPVECYLTAPIIPDLVIGGWPPLYAKFRFLQRFQELTQWKS